MTSRIQYLVTAAVAALVLICGVSTSIAQTTSPVFRNWMNPDVADAWAKGYKGQRTTITVIDDFTSGSRFTGNLGTGSLLQRHGEWTRLEASMIAPLATMKSQSFYSGTTVNLATGLNVLNLSYGMYARGTYTLNQLAWSAQESSIINYAKNGRAVGGQGRR
jgi:subtilisin family serine protease